MFNINPLLAIDYYKTGHINQYPENTTEVYSNFTARYVKDCPGLLPDFDNKVVVFGVTAVLESMLQLWEKSFFKKKLSFALSDYFYHVFIGVGQNNTDHIEALHNLGYLPICVKALPEGSRVDIGVPFLTIKNTLPEFFWITNFLESYLSAMLWKPMTVATIAFEYRRLFEYYAHKTVDGNLTKLLAEYQGHDFSLRGLSGIEDAAFTGAAHLTCFKGTDNALAPDFLFDFYNASHSDFTTLSVPATEHSVMCAATEENEFWQIKRLITEVYPSGPVSLVADTYDLWAFIRQYIAELKPAIMCRDGKVIIRPDSGDPDLILNGDPDAPEGSPQRLGVIKLLWEIFGGTTTEEGYKLLDEHIGVIYGDGITVRKAQQILQNMQNNGFASTNVTFGIGSFSYQYITRDTFGMAMKATSCVIDGKRIAIQKRPVTDMDDSKKTSAKGLICVSEQYGHFIAEQNVSEDREAESLLQDVFYDDVFIHTAMLKTIRKRIENSLIDKLLGKQA